MNDRQQPNRRWVTSSAWHRGLSLGLSLAIAVVILAISSRSNATNPPEAWWTRVDYASALLQSAETGSTWQRAGEFSVLQASTGCLWMDTRTKPLAYLSLSVSKFDSKVGSTAEIRLKALATPKEEINGFVFSLLDGRREGKISFRKDYLLIADINQVKATYKIDTHDFHTYRLTLVGNDFEVYVDGRLAAEATLTQSTGDKRLQLGDYAVGDTEMAALVDYVAYYTGGAVPPGSSHP